MIGTKICVKDSMNIFMSFRERMNEIMWLQKKHHELIDTYKDSPQSSVVLV